MSTIPKSALPPIDAQQRYTIAEAISYLRSSRKTFYDDVRVGRLRLIKDGRRAYVHGSELIRRSALSREAACENGHSHVPDIARVA